eukprot:GHVQ01009905.1.p1 GENE.GHVQ01009905.1~~GHVQ01009905.1.p1  ORF type:complete len:136 (-),score=16.56 GHVQ01009905.1:697-1104(-)
MARAVLSKDQRLRRSTPDKVRVGDRVVYYLQDHERVRGVRDEGMEVLVKYSPQWSTPVEVLEVSETNIKVKTPTATELLVPFRHVRQIASDIPQSLQQLNLASIERQSPRLRPAWSEASPKKRQRLEAASVASGL